MIEQEFDEIIDSLKTVAMDEEEDEEDEINEETQLDNLIHDLNKSDLLSKEYASTGRPGSKHNLKFREYSTEGYLKSQNSVDKSSEGSKLSAKFNAPRASLHELRKQFFTSETASTSSPFQSFGPTEELITEKSRPSNKNMDPKFESSSQFFNERLASGERSSTAKLTSNQPKQQSSNQQLSQSKSPKSSNIQLFKQKDDREPKYV